MEEVTVTKMNTATIDPSKYGRLLVKALPKIIETDKEFEAAVARLEAMSANKNKSVEEKALFQLLLTVIKEYDDKVELPELEPRVFLKHLMDQHGLRPIDMLDVFGSRSVASFVLSGKRGLSMSMIRKLSEFFKISPDVFISKGVNIARAKRKKAAAKAGKTHPKIASSVR